MLKSMVFFLIFMIMIGILAMSLGNPIFISNQTHTGKKIYTLLGINTSQTLEKLLFGIISTCAAIILVMIITKTKKFNMVLMQFLLLGLLIVLITLCGMTMALSIKLVTATENNKNADLIKTIPNLSLSLSQVYLTLSDGVIGLLFGLIILGSFISRMLKI